MTIDELWTALDSYYMYIAQDADGSIWTYSHKPLLSTSSLKWRRLHDPGCCEQDLPKLVKNLSMLMIDKWYAGDWTNSLVERSTGVITHQLKPFDKVLVRGGKGGVWVADFYSHFSTTLHIPLSIGNVSTHLVPYEGNEELIGTRRAPTKQYKFV